MATLRKNIFNFNKELVGYQLFDTDTNTTQICTTPQVTVCKTSANNLSHTKWCPKLSILQAAQLYMENRI